MDWTKSDSYLSLITDINRRNFQFLTRISHELQDKQFFLIKNKGYSREQAGRHVVSELSNFYNDPSFIDMWKGILNFWDCPNRFYMISGEEELFIRAIHFRHFIILSNYWDKIDGDDGFGPYLYAIIKNDWNFKELISAIDKYGNDFSSFPTYNDVSQLLRTGWISSEIKKTLLNYTL